MEFVACIQRRRRLNDKHRLHISNLCIFSTLLLPIHFFLRRHLLLFAFYTFFYSKHIYVTSSKYVVCPIRWIREKEKKKSPRIGQCTWLLWNNLIKLYWACVLKSHLAREQLIFCLRTRATDGVTTTFIRVLWMPRHIGHEGVNNLYTVHYRMNEVVAAKKSFRRARFVCYSFVLRITYFRFQRAATAGGKRW